MRKFCNRWFLYVLLCLFPISEAGATDKDGGQGRDFSSLKWTLAAISKTSPGKSILGISVVDVNSGVEIFSKNANTLLNPASNAKLVTISCGLKMLGPNFTYWTSLHGRRDGAVIRGPLYIKGHGDPTLSTRDLWNMVRALREAGVSRVEGGIIVDDTYFDGENLPYAFDQQENEDASFRAPVGAVSLNRNRIAITIRPGHQAMAQARVSADPPGYAVLVNNSTTLARGAHRPKISALKFENRTRIRVWGQVPLGASPVTYYRRIDNPSLFAGYGLRAVLESSGISVGGSVQIGPLPPGTPRLARHRSSSLSLIIYAAGKYSNNFVTETVLKTMGAETSRDPATWEMSLNAVMDILEQWGLPRDSYVYRNGSGLFDANRFSARQFTTLLRAVYFDYSVRPEFLGQLSIGGVDGTIRSRFQKSSIRGRIRAKTGTLSDVSALSGYVFDKEGRTPIAFSILLNNALGYVSSSRSFQEKIATAIGAFLDK